MKASAYETGKRHARDYAEHGRGAVIAYGNPDNDYQRGWNQALAEYDREHPQAKTWTVIGFWLNDEPYSAGVVAGSHAVYGGNDLDDTGEGFQGAWATSVEAASAEEAEDMAIEEMLDSLEPDDEEAEAQHRQDDPDFGYEDLINHDTVREQKGLDA